MRKGGWPGLGNEGSATEGLVGEVREAASSIWRPREREREKRTEGGGGKGTEGGVLGSVARVCVSAGLFPGLREFTNLTLSIRVIPSAAVSRDFSG